MGFAYNHPLTIDGLLLQVTLPVPSLCLVFIDQKHNSGLVQTLSSHAPHSSSVLPQAVSYKHLSLSRPAPSAGTGILSPPPCTPSRTRCLKEHGTWDAQTDTSHYPPLNGMRELLLVRSLQFASYMGWLCSDMTGAEGKVEALQKD